MTFDHDDRFNDPHALVAIINAVREATPLVQCLTNEVVSSITANALIAAGASPAMCDTPSESRSFAQIATGVLINAGTPTAEQYAGMREAIAGANEAGTPWTLDPVAAGGLSERTAFYREALAANPWVIRGNASEIAALAGTGTGGRGVDATDEVATVLSAAADLAHRTGHVVAVSGPADAIVSVTAASASADFPGALAETSGTPAENSVRITYVSGGHPTMTKVIGTGCFLGALTAAYAGAAKNAGLNEHDAVVAAHAHTKAAGAVAGEQFATKPGSFAVAWLDALAELSAEDIIARCEFTEEAASWR